MPGELKKEENNMSVNAENIHKLLTKYCGKYVPDCKIDYAKKEICNNPTEEKVYEMLEFLYQFDKNYNELNMIGCEAINRNTIRIAANDINKELKI